MHFRKLVANCLREYVAQEQHTPPQDIEEGHILDFVNALDGVYIDLIQCIFYALCGQEASDQSAVKTVGWWLAHPTTLTNVLYGKNVRVKRLGGGEERYPAYKLQAKWVRRNTHQEFSPHLFTLEQIRRVFEDHNDPPYPNSKPAPPPPKKQRRQKIPPNIDPAEAAANNPPSPTSPLDHPIFNLNDIPSPPSRSPPLLNPSHRSSSPVIVPTHHSPSPVFVPTHHSPSTVLVPSSSHSLVDTFTASSSGFQPGDAVNVATRDRPYLAAVVDKVVGDGVHYFHPALRVKKVRVIPSKFVKPFQRQIQDDGTIKLLKFRREMKRIKADKILVKTYEIGLHKYLTNLPASSSS